MLQEAFLKKRISQCKEDIADLGNPCPNDQNQKAELKGALSAYEEMLFDLLQQVK